MAGKIGDVPTEDVNDVATGGIIVIPERFPLMGYGELDRPEHEVHLRVILPVAFGATEVRPRR